VKIKPNDLRLKNITKERFVLTRIRKWLPEYPMIILSGPRRVGKTTALLQLAIENENSEYFDCGSKSDVERLQELMYEDYKGLILLDEFQLMERHADWFMAFNTCGQQNKDFRVVMTGSVAPYTVAMARLKGGGGRSGLIHLPFITYLEYLYFTGIIQSYDADLTKVDYGDSFLRYMTLDGLNDFMLPEINSMYVAQAANDVKEAKLIADHATSFLKCTHDDINRALLLLAYRLIWAWGYKTIFKEPHVGNAELGMFNVDKYLSQEGAIDNFSVWEAAKSSMTDAQISESLKYLLWTDLALCNYVTVDIDERLDTTDLTRLSLDYPVSDIGIQKFFSDRIQLYTVNPIIYSAISEELWSVLTDYVKNASDKTKAAFNSIRQKMAGRKTRGTFLRDTNIVGPWVEMYLRGSYALATKYTPLITTSFQDVTGKEIDIARGGFEMVLIEISVRRAEKTIGDVHFELAYTGKETCILTTKRIFDKVIWNNVPIYRIPYYMLAAFFDRGEVPTDDIFKPNE